MNAASDTNNVAINIDEAVARLRAGSLVAFPTETVYGLGADARNAEAVKKIFALKGRPAHHPIIVHLADASIIADWARDIPEVVPELSAAFLPGALTLILRRQAHVLDAVTGAQDTVGLRIPRHPVARALLREFGAGVAAPSANRFGRISPTSAAHVVEEFGDAAFVLDGGQSEVGLESTILDLTKDKARLLRPGGVSLAELTNVLGYTPETPPDTNRDVRVSGDLMQHYAPTTPAVLLSRQVILERLEPTVGVLAISSKPSNFAGVWLRLPDDAQGYAKGLYSSLRELDALDLSQIFIEAVPEREDWLAVRDRLRRATATG